MAEQVCQYYPGRCPCGCEERAELSARIETLEAENDRLRRSLTIKPIKEADIDATADEAEKLGLEGCAAHYACALANWNVALDELVEKRARVVALEAALQPFAKEYELLHPGIRDGDYYFTRTTQLRVGDLHQAAVVLKEPRRA